MNKHTNATRGLLTIATALVLAGCSATSLLSTVQDQVSLANSTMRTVSSPIISPSAGTYTTDQNITLTSLTQGATVYYTIASGSQGVPPSAVTPAEYTRPIAVSGNGTTVTIEAVAKKPGMTDSPVVTATFAVSYTAAETPVLAPSPGTYQSSSWGGSITIADGTSGATIYYTTDGSIPTPGSGSTHAYSSSISFSAGSSSSASETIEAVATAPGRSASQISVGTYTISPTIVPEPDFNPPGGTYTTNQTVTINDDDPSATIYYTTDGNNPSPGASDTHVYGGSGVSLSGLLGTITLKAMAEDGSETPSAIRSENYTVVLPL